MAKFIAKFQGANMKAWACQKTLLVTSVLLCAFLSVNAFAAPVSFEKAKVEARQHIYHDQNTVGTFYCGCEWRWLGRSGGRIDLEGCGYEIRKQQNRAERIEWEHIVPASNFGRARQCWQDGGRKNCKATDPVFNAMEADLHNLAPSIGEVNGDRSNYNFGMLPTTPGQHGACPVKVDFKQRTVEPRAEIKGRVARTYFYMHDRYNLPMSRQQQQLFIAWDRQYPVTAWEHERDRRVAQRMGHSNPFVTGEKSWRLGHRNGAEGVVSWLPTESSGRTLSAVNGVIRGNRNSKVYHLPEGCPSYDRVSERNIVEFQSEAEANAAGFRKAGNCK
jgi:deoxyribonuclease-1